MNTVELTFDQIRFLEEKKRKIKIQSSNGFVDIIDSYVKYGSGYIITFDDKTFIDCHEKHRILKNNFEWVTAIDIKDGDIILGSNYEESKTVISKTYSNNNTWIDFSVDSEKQEYLQNGILHHNSGKSLIQYLIIRKLIEEGNKVLLIVPSINLVTQMYTDFADYGWENINEYAECLWGGAKPTFKKKLLITTYQSLLKKDTLFFEDYTAILNDECHGVRSAELQNIGKKCINAHTRLGFTGTIPRDPSEYYNVQAMLGPVIFEQKSKELIDRGLLSGITVVNAFLEYPKSVLKESRGRSYPDEVNLIESTGVRNNFFRYLFKNIPDNQNTLILVNHIEHLNEIAQFIEKNTDEKYTLYIINGQIEGELREEIRRTTEEGSNIIIVATYGTMSQGVNIRKLHNVVFGSSCKSEIRVLQSIGRGLRLHESKSKMILWDLVDNFTHTTRNGNLEKNHVFKHWEFRTKYYKEQGFNSINKRIILEEV